ncbi:MAG TPA: enoyl-CoA hydratase/isomerase family protein [Planctomycetaceae bacterium]|jgi:enoyl-CoA hydratase/carnithine racemase|nr:enoyl-CoA hydratase/isomerase family protein [Planctomycetaceae bacterium]
MNETQIESRVEGRLLHVALNRPEKRNALTPDMLEAIATAVRKADDDPQIRAVIVSGQGPIFSAGIDLRSLGEMQAAMRGLDVGRWTRRFAERLQQALNTIEATEVPVIGALHGQVLGMGLELALAFDLRVATDDLVLAIPEARLGLVADVGGTTRLSRVVGPSRAKDLLMTARSIDAAEALQWGLVNRVVAPAELMARATELAEQIAANAPLAVGMAKLLVDQGDGLDKRTQMTLERWAQSQLLGTQDVQEAVQAFLQKRPANFQGK